MDDLSCNFCGLPLDVQLRDIFSSCPELKSSTGTIDPDLVFCPKCFNEVKILIDSNSKYRSKKTLLSKLGRLATESQFENICREVEKPWEIGAQLSNRDKDLVLTYQEHVFDAIRALIQAQKDKLLLAGVPNKFINAGFKNFTLDNDNRDFYEKINECSKHEKGMLLTGTVGAGKTHLAVATIRKQLFKKRLGFINISNFVSSKKDYFDLSKKINNFALTNNCPSINEQFEKLYTKDQKIQSLLDHSEYLILDDVGSENASRWTREEVLPTIINQLYNKANTKLIITTNLKFPTELEDHLGKRSFSRLIEMVPSVIKCVAADYRLRYKQ